MVVLMLVSNYYVLRILSVSSVLRSLKTLQSPFGLNKDFYFIKPHLPNKRVGCNKRAGLYFSKNNNNNKRAVIECIQ